MIVPAPFLFAGRPVRHCIAAGAVLLAGAATCGSAQARQQNSSASVSPANGQAGSGDIVVQGLPTDGALEQGVKPAIGPGLEKNRTNLNKSGIFARCLRNVPASVLRKVIDGPPNRADTTYAQGLLVSKHITCHLAYYRAPFDVAAAGVSIFDRDAVLEQAIKTYAPKLALTRAETSDPAVAARFNAVEVPRNHWRQPLDYRYFEIAVCMVRIEPELSVALLHASSGSTREKRIEGAIIGRARVCVGDARRVSFDPTEFRTFMIDALYRWVVAARGVDSLISDKPMGGH